MKNTTSFPRLASLDALRGFDLFVLVALGPLVVNYTSAAGGPAWLAEAFTHKSWEGFSFWDLIMPLFVFMSGASIPFALQRQKRAADYSGFTLRLLKRVVLLWLLGMMCQGNLLSFNPDRIYFYSNTLQSIAVGYAVGAVMYMLTSVRTQMFAFVALLLGYWAAMTFVSVEGFGGGSYTPDGNLAEWIDRTVLGRFRDGAWTDAAGAVHFASWYHYTWLLSSLGFAATALSGVMAGHIARSGMKEWRKFASYVGIGLLMLFAGWLWSLETPIIKTIWTTSMVLWSSGWCFLLLGVFYLWFDIFGRRTGLEFLKVYGMNSITAYLVSEIINFRGAAHCLLHGFEQFLDGYYPLLLTAAQVAIVFCLLLLMKRNDVYLKV